MNRVAIIILFIAAALSAGGCFTQQSQETTVNWRLEPVSPHDSVVLTTGRHRFFCPVRQDTVAWNLKAVGSPAVVVKDDKIYMLFVARDTLGRYGGTGRVGLAVSHDGYTFEKYPVPVFYPENDRYKGIEWEGGITSIRLVEDATGQYVMTYVADNGTQRQLCVATSHDLIAWRKHGRAFSESDHISTSEAFGNGNIASAVHEATMRAVKIKGKYWMYWHMVNVYAATSDDLIHWKPLQNFNGSYKPVMTENADMNASTYYTAGPAAIVSEEGIQLLHNQHIRTTYGDSLMARQMLLDADNPMQVLHAAQAPYLTTRLGRSGREAGEGSVSGLALHEEGWYFYRESAPGGIYVQEMKEPKGDSQVLNAGE